MVRTSSALSARPATANDIPTLSVSLARAFAADPVQRWMVPAANRHGRLLELFRLLLGIQIGLAHTYTTPDCVGAAVWAPPELWALDADDVGPLVEASVRILGPNLDRSVRLKRALDVCHPAAPPHWYLATLGTHPDWQRRGVGARVVQPVLARCDEEARPAYLESSNEQNLAFYRRHGFEVTRTIEVPDGPTLWGMWREPRPALIRRGPR